MPNNNSKDELYDNLFKSIKSELGVDPDVQALTPEEAVKNMEWEELRSLVFLHYWGKVSREYLLQRYTPDVADYLWTLLEDIRKRHEEEKRAKEGLKKDGYINNEDPQPEDQPEPEPWQ